LLVFALLASSASAGTSAQTVSTEAIPNHPALSDRFTLELGAFYSKANTAASLGPSGGGTGSIVNFENTLGLEDQNLSAIGGFLWRVTDRWRLEADYFSLNRSATRPLDTNIGWGDSNFLAGTTVETRFNFSDIRVSGGYSFFRRQDKELGVGLGVHVAGIKATIQAVGATGETGDVTAPLPVLNIYGMFALTDEWAVRVRGDWLSLNYGIYSGDLRNIAIDVLYRPFRNVGFGAGTRTYILDVDIDDAKWHGRARTSYTGLTAFMTVSF
jgi:hypothetical protein